MTVDAVKRRMLQVKDWTNQIKYEKKFAGKSMFLYTTKTGLPYWMAMRPGGGGKKFYFTTYGSGAAARRAAYSWSCNSGNAVMLKSREAATGLPIGVCIKRNNYLGLASYRASASYQAGGANKFKHFSFDKYGEAEAIRLAIAQRKAWEEEFALKPEVPVVAPIQPYENQYEVVQL